jgi:cell division protein FtsL
MTMLRLLHLLMVAALVFAAADVYKIKFDSTVMAERLARLRVEIRHEHEAIAALRAEWGQLDRPERIQALAQRHLTLRPVDVNQFDSLDRLPDRPIDVVPPATRDPIAAIIESYVDKEILTGSVPDGLTGR